MGNKASYKVSNLKSEIQIITLPNDLWKLWRSFFVKHANGELIDPISQVSYNEAKKFKTKSNSLKKKFFKHAGRFTNRDFGILAQHLLGITPNPIAPYPKVFMSKTKILALDNLTSEDWVE